MEVWKVVLRLWALLSLLSLAIDGACLWLDQNGVAAIHWPGYSNFSQVIGSMYISKDVANFTRKLPSP